MKKQNRFLNKIEKAEDGCWNYTGYLTPKGYGRLLYSFDESPSRMMFAHRVSLGIHGVFVPAGKVVDHMCRNRKCVNPEHLRVVDPIVNTLENSNSPSAVNHRKTHCKWGHEFTEENMFLYVKKGKGIDPVRICRTCHNASSRRAKRKRKLLALSLIK